MMAAIIKLDDSEWMSEVFSEQMDGNQRMSEVFLCKWVIEPILVSSVSEFEWIRGKSKMAE